MGACCSCTRYCYKGLIPCSFVKANGRTGLLFRLNESQFFFRLIHKNGNCSDATYLAQAARLSRTPTTMFVHLDRWGTGIFNQVLSHPCA